MHRPGVRKRRKVGEDRSSDFLRRKGRRPQGHREVRPEGGGRGLGLSRVSGHEVVRAREVVWTNRSRDRGQARRRRAPRSHDLQHPCLGFPHFSMLAADATPGRSSSSPTSTRSSPGWSGCSPPPARSTRSAAPTAAPGETSRTRRSCRLETYARAAAPSARCAAAPSGASADGRWACTPLSPSPTSGWRSSGSTWRRSTSGSWSGAPTG